MPRILALDHGLKRTGVAISDELRISCRPLPPIISSQSSDLLKKIKELLKEYEIERILVGLPINEPGKSDEQVQKVKKFATELQQATGKEIEFVDETFTSQIATNLLKEEGVKLTKKKGTIDSKAAQLILSSYLNS